MRTSPRSEHGYVLVWFSVSMILMLLLAAFVIDVGNWYLTRDRVQKAADAAAVAAAPLAGLSATEACKVAAQEAARNGYPDLLNNVYGGSGFPNLTNTNCGPSTAPVEISGNRVRVKLSTVVGSFFAQVAGITNQAIARNSAAEYNPELEMGSPSNVLGNEPIFTSGANANSLSATGRNQGSRQSGFRPGGGTQYSLTEWRPAQDILGANYWLNVTGPETPANQGDPATDENGLPPSGGSRFRNDYQFVVRTTNPQLGDRLVIQAFDPNLWNIGQQCERRVLWSGNSSIARLGRPTDSTSSISFPLGGLGNFSTYFGNDWGRYLANVNKWCTGDSLLKTECIQSGPNDGGPPTFFGTSTRNKVIATPVVAFGRSSCSLPDTTYEIYRQDSTPSNLGDNPLVSSGECSNNGNRYISGSNPRTYLAQDSSNTGNSYYGLGFQKSWGTPSASDGSDSTTGFWNDAFGLQNGVGDNNWTDLARNWNTLCTIESVNLQNPSYTVNGEFIVRVRTNGSQALGRSFGIGANRFSLRASLVGSGQTTPFVPSSTPVREYNPTSCANCGYTQVFSRSYLPLYVNISNGTFYLARVTEAYKGKTLRLTFFDPGESANGGTMRIIAPPDARRGNSAGPAVQFTNTTCSYDANTADGISLTATGSNCDIQIPATNSTTTGWDGRWVAVDVKIPNDYWCNSSSAAPDNRFNCWIRVNFNMGGQFIQDTTVWNAKVLGDPVRLVE